MTLGEKIKTLRTQKTLTQMELAKQINIHYTHIGKYENDQQLPSTETVKKIADFFEVSIDYLLNDDAETMIKLAFKDEDLLRLFKAAEKLPAKDKEVVKELITAFIVKNQIKEMVG